MDALGPCGAHGPRQERGLVLHQQLRLGPRLTAQTSLPVLLTALPQEPVELIEVPHLRHRHEEVEPRELHQPFHYAFLVAAPDPAEVVREEVILKTAVEDALRLRGGFESRRWV